MKLSIWHELEAPAHPMSVPEVEAIRHYAEYGRSVAINDADSPDMAILASEFEAIQRHQDYPLTPTQFIGYSLGVRAGKSGLDVDRRDSDGFGFSGISMARIRDGKAAGTHAAELNPEAPYEDILGEVLQIANRGDTSINSLEHVIGHSIGVRNFQLRVRV